MNKLNNLIHLFLVFMKIGLFTIGGGYVMLPLMIRELVDKRKWLTEAEMIDFFGISQTTPGVIATNTATFIGYRQQKIAGAIFATAGMVCPSLIIISLIAICYQQFNHLLLVEKAFAGIRIAVTALLLNTTIKLFRKTATSRLSIAIAIGALVAICLLHVSPAFIIPIGGLIGFLFSPTQEPK